MTSPETLPVRRETQDKGEIDQSALARRFRRGDGPCQSAAAAGSRERRSVAESSPESLQLEEEEEQELCR